MPAGRTSRWLAWRLLMPLSTDWPELTFGLSAAVIVAYLIAAAASRIVKRVLRGITYDPETDVQYVERPAHVVRGAVFAAVMLNDAGTVHVFPNGEVTTLANMSKEFAYSVLHVTIPSNEDPEHAIRAIRDAGALLEEGDWRQKVLEPIEVQGIDSLKPGEITLKARIKTAPLQQFAVGRELRRHVVRLFNERQIAWRVTKLDLNLEGTPLAAAGERRTPSERR